jgi:hypothetical protein
MTDDTGRSDDDEDCEDDSEEEDPEHGSREAAAPGLAVTALVGGIAGAVSFVAVNPGVAALVGVFAPFTSLLIQKTLNNILSDKQHKIEKMLKTAADTADLPPEELAKRADASEESRFLTDRAIQASADTIWPESVRAIGRAYATGLLANDKPSLNIRLRVLGIMKDLDELHVGLLGLLVRSVPQQRPGGPTAVPYVGSSYVNTHGGDGPGIPKAWSAGPRKWTIREITATMPHIQPVLSSLLGELRGKGLAQDNDTAPDAIKRFTESLSLGQAPAIRPYEPSWSPTELGEKALAFYAEAGADRIQES